MKFGLEILKERIRKDNSWWMTKTIPEYGELKKRKYYYEFYNLVSQTTPTRAVVLMGPRRVGKTVMMYQAIQDLIENGINPAKIFYLSLDTPIYTNIALEILFKHALDTAESSEEECYVFFDEIQYLKDWEIHLKSLVDSYRRTKFVTSGSAAAALRMKSIESGAGRFSDYFLPPLTFSEYIDLKEFDYLLEETETKLLESRRFYLCKNIQELNNHFIDYMNFGGFPEIALAKDQIPDAERMIQKDITEKVIMKDLPGLFGIENTLELQQFFNVLAYRTGEIVNYKKISEDTNTDNKTIKKYFKYLEAAFLFKILHKVDVNAKRFRNITQFKVHLTNPSLFTGLFGKIDENNSRFGHLVETAVFTQYLHRDYEYLRYARWPRGEIDLIQLNKTHQQVYWALEIKWSNNPKSDNLKYFLKKNKSSKGILTSKEIFSDEENLLIAPCSVYAYAVGKNALDKL